MQKNKTVYLILLLLALLIIIVLVQLVGKSTPNQVTPAPNVNIPTALQTSPSKLSVLQTTTTGKMIAITDQFSITFSEPILPQTLEYTLSPATPLQLSLDNSGKVLTINPSGTWNFDTEYILIIKKGLKSGSGKSLGADVNIQFKTSGYGGI